MTVTGGGHGGASRMDPGRGGSSSRTEFGREGSSSPTGTPGLEPATERTPASTSRAFDVVAASARSSLARLTAATGAADAILDDGRAVLAELESRGFDLDELESAWSAPPESEARRDRTARARTTKPRASVSNGRERHRPSLRPPSRLVFRGEVHGVVRAALPPRVSASTDDGEEDGQRGDRRHRRATYPRGRRSVPSR